MSTVLRRIGERHWSAITEIAALEGREPRNVLELVIDRGLAARALGDWPTPLKEQIATRDTASLKTAP
jgi:hypothetical protein